MCVVKIACHAGVGGAMFTRLKNYDLITIAIRRRPENKLNTALLKPTALLTCKNDLNTFTDILWFTRP